MTQTSPEDPAETPYHEAVPPGGRVTSCPVGCDDDCTARCHEDHLPRFKRTGCFVCQLLPERDAQQPEPAVTDTSWLKMEPIGAAGRRHARRTSTPALLVTCALTGLASGVGGALLVWAVAHALGAR